MRVAGSSHSHAPLLPTDGVIVDTSGLAGVISTDTDTKRAWLWAGTTIYAMGLPLQQAGLALGNQGDIDRQSIAGVVGTGTHGTGRDLPNLSAAVTGARVALADGTITTCSADTNPDLWQVARLNLGGLGIITQLELQLRNAYRLRQTGWEANLDATLERVPEEVANNRHFEFFWFPTADFCAAKATNETDDPAEYPLAEEGERCGWSHEVLPNHRDWPHTEMEYSVPTEVGIDCLRAIRDLLASDFPDMGYPIEYRTVAADDVWMSASYERPTVTISVHMAVEEDDEPLFRACEKVFVAHGGKPHWGKVHYRTSTELAACHDRWSDWWNVRDNHDPDDMFLNDHLRALRDGR